MKKKVYETVIDNIKIEISNNGFKQNAIAKRCGFNEMQFSNILNNRKLLRIEHLPIIAHVLNMSIEEFYYERNEKI